MEQRINPPGLPIRLVLFFLLIAVPRLLPAQEYGDSIRIIRDIVFPNSGSTLHFAPLEIFPQKSTTYPAYPPKKLNTLPNFSLKENIHLPYYTNPSPIFRGDYSTRGILKQFPQGVLFGTGGQTSLPGIGRFNEASLGFQHAFNDKFALQVRANVMKINMTHFAGQSFSASGAFLYHPSDKVTFKVFGSYDLGNSYGMSTNVYGASMSFDMSERFGMEVGVQRYYDAMRGRWETVPIVIPYYRFEKFTLGLDVGGLVYELLRDLVFDKRDNSGPTIMPPRTPIPIR